jgi:CzcA family heavy metal efflux pump
MFRWIIGSSLEFRALVVAGAAALVLLGGFQARKMPVDVFPEFRKPVVEVQTEALGLSAEEVEALITLNLEELLSGVPWLESIRSESVIGLSSIVLTFERGTDLVKARQMVQERLTLAYALPNVSATPTLLQPLSSTSRLMMVGVTSDEIEETELSLLARWTMKPKLVGVPGVANVAIWGQRLREMQVQIDPVRLRDARLTQEDIIGAVGNSLWITPLSFLRGSSPGTGGFIDNHNQRLSVHHKMPIFMPEDMAQVPVTPQHLLLTGKKMALGEVAEVTYSHPQLIGDAYVNGGTGMLLVIEKFPSANTLEVTRGVEEALAELKRGLPGVELNTSVFRLATYIEESVDNLTTALMIGGFLVVLVVGAFLFNWRSTLISVIAVPVALLSAIAVLSLTGATINTMILAGLVVALGVIIEDAIVTVDRLMGRLREHEGGDPSLAALILQTTTETRGSAMYATIIVLLAVLPIFFMGGDVGAFFEPLAIAYLLAVLAAVVVGATLTPALCLMLFRRSSLRIVESPIAVTLRNAHEALLRRVAAAPRAALAVGAVLIVAGIAPWPWLGQSLLPPLKENDVVVNWTTPPGTSYPETFRITSRVSQELEALPGVRDVSAHIGRAITGDQVVGIHSAQIWVGLEPDADFDEVLARVRETVDGYPGVDRSVHGYLRETVGAILTGERTPIVVRIFGHDRAVLRGLAEEVRAALSGIDGLVELRAVDQIEEPQVRVAVDLEAARRANVNPGEVRRSSSTVFSGLTVGFLFEEQKVFDVRVWSPPEVRESLTDLEDVLVEKSDRHHVRLGDVAEVSVVPVPTVIKHYGVAPYMDVVAGVAGRDLGAVSEDVARRLDRVNFPLEYHASILGEFTERRSAQGRLIWVSATALIGILLLLQACFGSWRLALTAFLALPASVAGGVLAALASGGGISLGSIVGFLAVLGIAVRNSILLVSHYQRLERHGMPFGLELVIRGVRERFTPIIASSAAIVAALLPILLIGQVAGLEIVHPISIVVIGGVIASTLVTLLVVPAMYLIFAARADRQPDLGLAEA